MIRVGIVGANPERGWAGEMHVPAVRAASGVELVAVATSRESSARAAEAAWGVRAYADPIRMIQDPAIDLVTIAVKAPAHAPLVEAAIEAGKAVCCEWPLGSSLGESERLAALAARHGVVTAIGLQGRFSPWVEHVRGLVADGYVGELRSVTLSGWDLYSTGTVSPGNAYMHDPDSGANPLTIMAAHTFDTLFQIVGQPRDVVAQMTTSVPIVAVAGTDDILDARNPDQIALLGRLSERAQLSAHMRAGTRTDETVRIEIDGADGFLRLTVADGYVHWGPIRVSGRRGDGPLAELPLPASAFDARSATELGPAYNIARLYEAIARRVRGEGAVPDFTAAVAYHAFVEGLRLGAVRSGGSA